ncbi:MAG: FAD-dependent oxidoreductase [Anaerolineaceae bacterium]|nr:FAD-dependent oxidoreductase [Anaerolineaceae bacterium]
MNTFEHTAEILVVGAGMAGLTAASDLQQAGHPVLVIDKGRGVGGRLASRRIGLATFDHGAQFMTARDARFAAAVKHWLNLGVLAEWYRGTAEAPGGHPRWRGNPAMTAVAKTLASDLNLLLEKKVVSLRRESQGWVASLESGEKIFASAVLLTPPVPQSLALLDFEELSLPPSLRARLESIEYERCLALMAVLAEPSRIPLPGGLAPSDGPIAWIADNQLKGISSTPAVTIHATPAFSLEHWDHDRQESAQELLRAARKWLGSNVLEFQVHGWRYSKPVQVEQEKCLVLKESPVLLLAGDAFGGARVEGAALSGWAAAATLKRMI